MPVSVSIEHPDDNDIFLHPEFLLQGNGFVSIVGKGNTVFIDRPVSAGDSVFVLHNGATVTVQRDSILGSLKVYALAQGARVLIGKNIAVNSLLQVTAHEKADIEIGEGCLFGPETTIAASDVHKIFDKKTSRRLNPAGNIKIGDRVWVSAKCAIFRNTVIGNDSVVGWSSMVKGVFPDNVVLAGSPAKVVRKGVRWEH